MTFTTEFLNFSPTSKTNKALVFPSHSTGIYLEFCKGTQSIFLYIQWRGIFSINSNILDLEMFLDLVVRNNNFLSEDWAQTNSLILPWPYKFSLKILGY